MDFFEVVRKRASVRSFGRCDISRDELEKILDAGRRAPSGYNRQPWEFIVIADPDTLGKLGRVQRCIADAGAAIAVVVDEAATEYWKEDAAAAIENMLLAAVALGYGSLWVEGYMLAYEEYGKELLGVPGDKRLLALLPIGEPSREPRQGSKYPLSQLVHAERYGTPWE
jgi:nitroreductase